MAAPVVPPSPPAPPAARLAPHSPSFWDRTPWPGIRRFLQRHPALCLVLAATALIEYLSGDSPPSLLLLSPLAFAIELVSNLALYGPAALLVREAMVRWKKGWASVLLLGAAYGIVNEGIAADTLFYAHAGPDGGLGSYGHYLGVNWVWTAAILLVHAVWSISLPILFVGLALPETRGKRLLTDRETATALAVLAFGAGLLMYVVSTHIYHYFIGPWLLAGCLVGILLLALAAYRVPADLLRPRTEQPQKPPWALAVAGLAALPVLAFFETVPQGLRLPPVLAIAGLWLVEGLVVVWVLRNIGRTGNARHLVAYAIGLVVPIIPAGFLAQIGTGIGLVPVAVADASAILFLLYLWRKSALVPIPPPRASGVPRPG